MFITPVCQNLVNREVPLKEKQDLLPFGNPQAPNYSMAFHKMFGSYLKLLKFLIIQRQEIHTFQISRYFSFCG